MPPGLHATRAACHVCRAQPQRPERFRGRGNDRGGSANLFFRTGSAASRFIHMNGAYRRRGSYTPIGALVLTGRSNQ